MNPRRSEGLFVDEKDGSVGNPVVGFQQGC